MFREATGHGNDFLNSQSLLVRECPGSFNFPAHIDIAMPDDGDIDSWLLQISGAQASSEVRLDLFGCPSRRPDQSEQRVVDFPVSTDLPFDGEIVFAVDLYANDIIRTDPVRFRWGKRLRRFRCYDEPDEQKACQSV